MSSHRPPPSCSWHTLLAVPLALFVVVLIILYLFSPERVQARSPAGETTVDTVDARGGWGVFLGLGVAFLPGGGRDPSRPLPPPASRP